MIIKNRLDITESNKTTSNLNGFRLQKNYYKIKMQTWQLEDICSEWKDLIFKLCNKTP